MSPFVHQGDEQEMEIKAEAMSFSYALTRILNSLKEKGFTGTARAVIKHLNRGVVQYHPYVTGRNCPK